MGLDPTVLPSSGHFMILWFSDSSTDVDTGRAGEPAAATAEETQSSRAASFVPHAPPSRARRASCGLAGVT